MPRRPVLAALAALPLLGLAALAVTCCRPPAAPIDTPEGVRRVLAARELRYEAHEVLPGDPALEPGYYLRREGDSRPWRDLTAQDVAVRPWLWRGYVRLTHALRHVDTAEEPHRRRLGPFLLVGDPEEVARVAEAFR